MGISRSRVRAARRPRRRRARVRAGRPHPDGEASRRASRCRAPRGGRSASRRRRFVTVAGAAYQELDAGELASRSRIPRATRRRGRGRAELAADRARPGREDDGTRSDPGRLEDAEPAIRARPRPRGPDTRDGPRRSLSQDATTARRCRRSPARAATIAKPPTDAHRSRRRATGARARGERVRRRRPTSRRTQPPTFTLDDAGAVSLCAVARRPVVRSRAPFAPRSRTTGGRPRCTPTAEGRECERCAAARSPRGAPPHAVTRARQRHRPATPLGIGPTDCGRRSRPSEPVQPATARERLRSPVAAVSATNGVDPSFVGPRPRPADRGGRLRVAPRVHPRAAERASR